MHTRITIFVILTLIILGFEIQSGRVRIVGGTYITDSTTELSTWSKGLVVNGNLKTNGYDMVVPSSYALRLGNESGSYIANNAYDILYNGTSHIFSTYSGYNIAMIDSIYGMTFFRRIESGKGSSSVTAASKITLGGDGNAFTVTGNTNIDTIATDGWVSGAHITLYFTGTPTINNQSTGTGRIYCQGSNISVTAGDVYEFFLDGTIWRRIK